MTAKLERAAYSFAQAIRGRFSDNVNVRFTEEWKTLNVQQQCLVLALVEDAVANGYRDAYPWLLSSYEADVASHSNVITFPDAIIDQAARFVELGRVGKRDFGAFTIVRDEPFFLLLWCSYYSRAFGEENLYVLDNSTSDGSVETAKRLFPRINIIDVPNDNAMNWAWCTNIVKCFQRIFLRGYNVVVFSDADEYLVPEDGHGLRTYCERFLASDDQYVRATGWGVVHQVETEPLVVTEDSILDFRTIAYRTSNYDKTLISKIPLEWAKGNHTIYIDGKKLSDDPIDLNLSLVHLRDFDSNIFFNHCQARAKIAGSAYQVASIHGASNLQQVKNYLRTLVPSWGVGTKEYSDETKNVSEVWKNAFRQPRR